MSMESMARKKNKSSMQEGLARDCSGFGGGGGSTGEMCDTTGGEEKKSKPLWLVQPKTLVNFTYLYMLFLFKFNLSFSHLISIKWD